MDVLKISGSALVAERLRMDVIASNLANMNSTHNAQGEYEPYHRKILQFETVLDDQLSNGITVRGIEEDQSPLKKVFDPTHPNADEDGYINYPNVSLEREMVDMASAKAAYEANIQTIQTFKSMFNSALGI